MQHACRDVQKLVSVSDSLRRPSHGWEIVLVIFTALPIHRRANRATGPLLAGHQSAGGDGEAAAAVDAAAGTLDTEIGVDNTKPTITITASKIPCTEVPKMQILCTTN